MLVQVQLEPLGTPLPELALVSFNVGNLIPPLHCEVLQFPVVTVGLYHNPLPAFRQVPLFINEPVAWVDCEKLEFEQFVVVLVAPIATTLEVVPLDRLELTT